MQKKLLIFGGILVGLLLFINQSLTLNSKTVVPTAAVQSVTVEPTTTTAPTSTPTLAPTAYTPTSTNTGGGGYTCDCSRTCTQISSCAEAQYQLNVCGCYQRDADHDGIACDSAPRHCQN